MKTVANHTYRCANGHAVASKDPVEQCPAFIYGQPCPGELEPVNETAWWGPLKKS